MVGRLGAQLARHNVNIASMNLTRDTAGGLALTVLNLDSMPPAELLEELKLDADITNVKMVRL
jgi:D-3-phosphoglycerate dehydrogenase